MDIEKIKKIKQHYDEIFLLLSPPRCSSTTLARVFWEHPTIGFYSHEPYEMVFHHGKEVEVAHRFITNPIVLKNEKARSLIIKEMTFQVGGHFMELAEMTNYPLVFLMRDPRLNFWSRMKKFQEGADNADISYEDAGMDAGWDDLLSQVNRCKESSIPYFIVDSTEFRNFPQTVFKKLFDKIGLSFSEKMLQWQPRPDIDLCKPGGGHIKHFYQRSLDSTGIQPATEPIPDVGAFDPKVRPLLEKCNRIYNSLNQDSNRITP